MTEPLNPRRPRRRLLWIAGFAAVGLILLGGARAYRTYPLRALPEVNAAGANPAVREAIDKARAAVVAAPRSGAAWGQLGSVLLAHDFQGEAEVCFGQAERFDSREVAWPYLLGVIRTNSDLEGACNCFRRAEELRPDLTLPQLRLGEVLLERREIDAARSQFQRALAIDPNNPRANLGMARVACLQGDFRAALLAAQESAARAHSQRATHELLLQVYHRLGDDRGAFQERNLLARLPASETVWQDRFVERVMMLRRDGAWVAGQAQSMLGSGRAAEAVALLEELVREEPRDPQWPVLLGRTLVKLHEHVRAAVVLDAARNVHPDSPEIRCLRGSVFFFQQDWAAAAKQFEEAIQIKPDYSEAHYNLGHTRRRAGDRDGAIVAFRTALRFQPDFAAAHANLGELLLQKGDRAKALEHLRIAVQLDPEDPAPRRLLERGRDTSS